jgi:cytochrome bd-type quinol oxidase subunit 1
MYILGCLLYLALFVAGFFWFGRKFRFRQNKLLHAVYIWGAILLFVAIFAGGG